MDTLIDEQSTGSNGAARRGLEFGQSGHGLEFRRVQRRISVTPPKRAIRFGGLTLDEASKSVLWNGQRLTLPHNEHRLLVELLRNAGRIVGHHELSATLSMSRNLLDERIQRLRLQLRRRGIPCIPCTVDGIGYLLWRR